MTTGDVVYTSSATVPTVVTTDGSHQKTSLRGGGGSGGVYNDNVDLDVKVSSPVTNPFDVTKQYVVEIKEA